MAEEKTTPGGTKYTDYLAAQEISNESERRAYLALMAQHGMEAKQIWDRQATRDAALAGGRGASRDTAEAANAGNSQAAIDGLIGSATDQTGAASLSHARELERIAAANAAYLQQVRGSVDIQDPVGGSGGGGSRGSGSGSGSDGSLDDFLLDDLFGGADRGEPSDALFVYNEDQLNDLNPALDGDARAFGIEVRARLEELAAQGASPDELAGTLADMLDSSGLSRQHQGQLATTMDNRFGLSEEGARGAATVDLYYTEEDQEFDRMSRRAEDTKITADQRRQMVNPRVQEALALRAQAMRAIENAESGEVGPTNLSIAGFGSRRLYDPEEHLAEQRLKLDEANKVLLDLLDSTDDLDLGFTQDDIKNDKAITPQNRKGGEISKDTTERGTTTTTDDSNDRAEKLRMDRLASADRRRKAEEAARREAEDRRRQAESDRIAEARQRDADLRRQAAERARLAARREALRRRWGKTFEDDEYDDDEFVQQADTDFERLAEERRRASVNENRTRTSRVF